MVGASGEDSGPGAVWVLPGGASRPLYSSAVMLGPKSLGLSGSLVLLGGDAVV